MSFFCSRAAHFATWDSGGGAGGADETANGDGIHTGGNAARGLGPWSSAVQLANAREQEREKRENKILEAARGSNGTTGKPSIWTPSRDVALGERPRCDVPLLSHITLRLVVDLLEDVETLWGLPDLVKNQIAAAACRQRALSPATFRLFVEHSPAEICLPDCSYLDPEVLLPGILEAATPKLEKLDLGLCGRGLTDSVAADIATRGVLSSLKSLRLSGAYRLSDEGLIKLLRKAPNLTSLALPQCSRIEGPSIEVLPQLVPQLQCLNLGECRGLGFSTISAAVRGLPHLQSLSLDGISEVDDAMLRLLSSPGIAQNLTDVSIAACPGVTSDGITALAQGLPALRKLVLDECGKVDGTAVTAVAQHCTTLQEISVVRCIGVDDEAVIALSTLDSLHRVRLGGVVGLSSEAVIALATGGCNATLEEVDLSWCRKVRPEALGLLADRCINLKRLVLWGCSQVDDSPFLLGHSNEGLTVVGRGARLCER